MFLAIVSYFITIYFITKTLNKNHISFKEFPTFNMMKEGIFFRSKNKHRIRIENCKYEQMGKSVYVVKNGKLMEIKNVDNIFKKNEYLYFHAQGKVEIIYKDFKEFDYFYFQIMSEKFNIKPLKQKALEELINNFFNINICENAKKYLIIVKKVLKITISEKKLIIKQNKFKFPYQIRYSTNGKNKIININQYNF